MNWHFGCRLGNGHKFQVLRPLLWNVKYDVVLRFNHLKGVKIIEFDIAVVVVEAEYKEGGLKN